MKIGILTYHRSHNYGALLQAVALRKVVENLGHEVYYIDYFPDYHQEMYKWFSFYAFNKQGPKGKLRYIKNSIKKYAYWKERREHFLNFQRQYIFPYCKGMDEKFDVVLYGSDQIWRKQYITNVYNPIYFGKNEISASRHVSYAASMGILPNQDEDSSELKNLLSYLDSISVRELGLLKLVDSLGIKNAKLVLDPTLLLSSKDWDALVPTERLIAEPYCLYYSLIKDSFDEKNIRQFAIDRGLRFITLLGTATQKQTVDKRTVDGPIEFVNLIRYADFVFTSSYHGMVFSLIYNRPFYASFSRNSERAASLLHTLGLDNHILTANSIIPQYRDYDLSCMDKLKPMRCNSIEFLKSNIDNYEA